MKVMITANDSSIDSMVSDRFARAPYFIIYDIESQKSEVLENEFLKNSHGVGPKAVQIAVDNGVAALISAVPGGNSMEALKKAEIDVYDGRGLKVSEAISKMKSGELNKIL